MVIQPPEGGQTIVLAEACLFHGALQNVDGLVVDAQRDGEGVAVFAAVGEGEAGGIGETAGGAVDDLRHQGEGEQGAGTDARHQQKLGEILWPASGHGAQRLAEPSEVDVLGAHVVMGRHRQLGSGARVLAGSSRPSVTVAARAAAAR